jgi:hypothetical protein
MALLNGPQLSINYAPELDLSLTCVKVHKYAVASPEYRFKVNCRISHPTGHFEYSARDLCFEPAGFARFAEGLHGIEQGAADSAALMSVGEMLVFQLDRSGGKWSLKLSIREALPPGKLASLTMAVEADYDLLINKLGRKVEDFIANLREVAPSFDWTHNNPDKSENRAAALFVPARQACKVLSGSFGLRGSSRRLGVVADCRRFRR